MRPARLFGGTVALWIGLLAVPAFAHKERPIASPIRPGPLPDINRVNPNRLVVCKPSSKPTAAELAEIEQRIASSTGDALVQAQADLAVWQRNSELFNACCFEHIQDAVNAAGDNTDILVLPGYYREEPSRAAPTSSSGDLPDGSYSYDYHVANPNDANLIAILGKTNITLEGTGSHPQDVIVDAGFVKDVGIRCDRCTGVIVRNLWEKDANEHGIYVVDSDGYIFDRTIGSFNKEYELFAFSSDNGLFTDCEAFGGGDSGLYVGGAPVTPGRFSSTVQRCILRHNALGFSGTQGNSVHMIDNDIYDNAIGISFDSENDHPNFPQAFAVIEDNDIHDNNFDVYATTSDVPVRGPGYSFFRYPVGTGMWIVGGEDNLVTHNRVYNNIRFGFILAGNPTEAPLLAQVHRNSFVDNSMGAAAGAGAGPNSTAFPPGGDYAPGGSDFFWDETGNDNCWTNTLGPVTVDPNPIPGPCPFANTGDVVPVGSKLDILLSCLLVPVPNTNPQQYRTNDVPYPCPWGQTNDAPYQSSAEAECGNGVIDPGEDCDPVYGYGGPNLNGESCLSLGHGDGTLGCDTLCQWDFSGCSVTAACRSYDVKGLRVRRLTASPGDQRYRLVADGMEGAVFDTASEAVDVVIRDETSAAHVARIPAGDPHWSIPGPSRAAFRDPLGSFGSVTRIKLRANGSFSNAFRAEVKLNAPVDLAALSGAETAKTIIRIGDDCWERAAPCTLNRSGRRLRCHFPERTCGN